MEYGIALFDTTQAAIRAEKVLKQANILTKLIPVPRHISSNCGISLVFDVGLIPVVKSVLNKGNVPFSSVRRLDKERG